MKIALSSESSIDLTQELSKKFNISTIPFSIIIGGHCFNDETGITDKIFDYVNMLKELPKTSAVNVEQYKTHFTNLLKTNDIVLHVAISSTLSSAYNNAVTASLEFEQGKVFVVDSKSASCGIAIMLIEAKKMIENNLGIEDIIIKFNDLKQKIAISFVANNLEYLKRGGRCSKLQYIGANLLKIKPEIVYEKGEAIPAKKFLGLFSGIIKPYFKDVFTRYNNPDLENIFIVYTTAENKDIAYLQNNLKLMGFKNIYTLQVGGTISSHIGPKAIGLIFLQK